MDVDVVSPSCLGVGSLDSAALPLWKVPMGCGGHASGLRRNALDLVVLLQPQERSSDAHRGSAESSRVIVYLGTAVKGVAMAASSDSR